jgi:hypothetical protein
VLLVIVVGGKVGHGVYKTEHKTVGSPINDDVDGHIIRVEGDFVSLFPR